MNLIDWYSLPGRKVQQQQPSTSSSLAAEQLPHHLAYLKLYLTRRWPTATIHILDHYDDDLVDIEDIGRYQVIVMRNLRQNTADVFSMYQKSEFTEKFEQKVHRREKSLEYLNGQLEWAASIRFKQEMYSIQIRSWLLQNGRMILLDARGKIINAVKLSAKINKVIEPQSLIIHPLTGAFYLSFHALTHRPIAPYSDPMRLFSFSESVFDTLTIMYYSSGLLQFLIDQDQIQLLRQSIFGEDVRGRIQIARKTLKSIQESLYAMFIGIIYARGEEEKQIEKVSRFNKHQPITNRYTKSYQQIAKNKYNLFKRQQIVKNMSFFNEQMTDALNLYVTNAEAIQYSKELQFNHLLDECPPAESFSSYSYLTDPLASAVFNAKIISKIIISSQGEWTKLMEGGFGMVQIAEMTFVLVRDQGDFGGLKSVSEQLTCKMVRKSDLKKSNHSKVNREKDILNQIKDCRHPNILSFFISDNPAHSAYIYSIYSQKMSLDNYLQKDGQTISLWTKIFMLVQAARGVLFLHKRKIIHLDIKPLNFIISRRLVLKVADFGQAFLTTNKSWEHKYGLTVPYAPPQLFYNEPPLNQKIDVYALGVTIYRIVFGTHIFGLIRNKNEFIRRLKKQGVLPMIVGQGCQRYGSSRVMKILLYLSLRCIEQDQQKRPNLQWVITILEQCKIYLSYIFQ